MNNNADFDERIRTVINDLLKCYLKMPKLSSCIYSYLFIE